MQWSEHKDKPEYSLEAFDKTRPAAKRSRSEGKKQSAFSYKVRGGSSSSSINAVKSATSPTALTRPSLISALVNSDDLNVLSTLQVMFMRGGVNVNEQDSTGRTPLMLAVMRKYNQQLVKLLLISNSSPMLTDRDGMTALHWAIECGNYKAAKLLIEKCERSQELVNITARSEDTPLKMSARIGDQCAELVRVLLMAGAEIDSFGNRHYTEGSFRTALHVAAMYGSNDILNLLISWGANANATDSEGQTPLHLAAKNNQQRAFRLLLLAGANSDQKDLEEKTPLSLMSTRFE